jgi:hypothetical protein
MLKGYLELPSLRPMRVGAGYRFSCALTVDDLTLLRDLRSKEGRESNNTYILANGLTFAIEFRCLFSSTTKRKRGPPITANWRTDNH